MKRAHASIAILLSPLLIAASTSAFAIIKWDSGNCVTSGLLASCSPTTEGPPSVAYSAISNTGTGATLASAYVGMYGSNMGVTSKAGPNASPSGQETTSSPQHSMDNDGNSEFMLLSFASASGVSLSAVELGWSQTDSDITVLAYKPTGIQPADPSATLTNGSTTYALLAGLGWKLVGNYANVCTPTACASSPKSVAINGGATPLSSSYWLIGAYNSTNFGTASDPNSSTASLGTGNDYVKLLSVSGVAQPNTPPNNKTPEPGSWLLVGVGILGLTGLRRRRAAIAGAA